MKNIQLILFTAIITGILISCNRDEPTIQTSLTVRVIDEIGDPVTDAGVELYSNFDDWINESSPVYEAVITDLEGKASFTNIDSGSYFINAYKGHANNWEEQVLKPVIDGFENTTNVTVTENGSGNLASAPGKKWIMTSFLTNGGDYYPFLENCVKDDTLIFFKGPHFGAHITSRGSLKCSSNQEDNIMGFWTLLDNNSILQLQIGNNILNWNIDTLKVEKLSVTYVESGNIQKVDYIPIE